MVRAVALGLVVLAARPANACPAQVHVRDAGPAWEAAAEAVRAELAVRPDVDRCAEVEVASARSGARITVWFDDGRRATRDVASPRELRVAILILVLAVVPVALPLELQLPPTPETPPRIHNVIDRTPDSPELRERAGLALGGELGTTSTGGESLGATLRGSRGPWSLAVAAHASRVHTTGALGFTARDTELAADLGYRMQLGSVPLTVFAGPRLAWLGQVLDRAQPPSYVTVTNPKTGASETHPVDDTREATVVRVGAGVRAELVAAPRFALGLVARVDGDVTSDFANHLAMTSVRTPELATWSCELVVEGEVRLWR